METLSGSPQLPSRAESAWNPSLLSSQRRSAARLVQNLCGGHGGNQTWGAIRSFTCRKHVMRTHVFHICTYLKTIKNLYMTCNKEDPMITMFLFKALVFYDFATLDLMMVMLTYGPCSLLSHGGTNSRDSTLARLPFSDLYSLSKGDDWVRTAKRC